MDYNYINYLLILMTTNNNDNFILEKLYTNELYINIQCSNCDKNLNDKNIVYSSKALDCVIFYCSSCGKCTPYTSSSLNSILI